MVLKFFFYFVYEAVGRVKVRGASKCDPATRSLKWEHDSNCIDGNNNNNNNNHDNVYGAVIMT